ncbi:hypothetical protein VM98_35940, partial [Streptomyces rubellomurinus subsp. indigoferus]
RGRFTFRLVCPPPEPGITAYDNPRDRLERRIAEVNAKRRQGRWQPVDYLPRGLDLVRGERGVQRDGRWGLLGHQRQSDWARRMGEAIRKRERADPGTRVGLF